MEKANCKEKKNKYARIFENGLKEHVVFLMQQGFFGIAEILRSLEENNNDKEKALTALLERRRFKIEKKIKKLEQFEKGELKETPEDREKRKLEKKEKRGLKMKKYQKYGTSCKEKLEKIDREKLKFEMPLNTMVLILDGNNMLFADDHIRKLRLKGKKGEAEKKLIQLALEFSISASIQDLTIIFDVTKLSYDCNKDEKGNELVTEGIVNETNKHIKLRVFSANPNFNNSDDALVTMSANYSKDDLAKMIFVTSDQELLKRLDEKGSQVMKTGVWFKLAKAKLGEHYDSIFINN
jgi:predicted RNA-binding protein with PIN domain